MSLLVRNGDSPGGVESTRDVSSSNPENFKPYACVTCSRRKVRCDKTEPCSTCRKSGVDCVYRAPGPPQPRKRRAPETILLERLGRAEDLLKSMGVKVDTAESDRALQEINEFQASGSNGCDDAPQSQRPRLVERLPPMKLEAGQDSLWVPAASSFIRGALDASAKEEGSGVDKRSQSIDEDESATSDHNKAPSYLTDMRLLLEPGASVINLMDQYPSRAVLYPLWRAFLENVNPLSKIIHAPSVEPIFFPEHRQQGRLTHACEALLFAVLSTAVNSLSDEECQRITGEARSSLLPRLQSNTRSALCNGRFLGSSNIMLLQAYTLYLLSARNDYDHNTLWTLIGIATRIGLRHGLDREIPHARMPVLQAELRRRLWFQIISLEDLLSEITGVIGAITSNPFLNAPLNVNDHDLDANMTQEPPEHKGATEMYFCLLRYTIGIHFRIYKARGILNVVTKDNIVVTQAAKDEAIEEFEAVLGEKFLRYSDPVEPLHNLGSTVARTAICKLKWMSNHPRNYPDMSPKDKDALFQVSLRMLEYDDLICSNPRLAKYSWHSKNYFQWDTFIFCLTELQSRRAGEDVERAWRQIEQCYQYHQELVTDGRQLHSAVRSLTMKAWNAHEAEMTRRYPGLFTSEPPRFVTQLRAVNRAARSPRHAKPAMEDTRRSSMADSLDPHLMNPNGQYGNGMSLLSPHSSDYNGSGSMIPTDWSQWDALMQDPLLYANGGYAQSPFNNTLWQT